MAADTAVSTQEEALHAACSAPAGGSVAVQLEGPALSPRQPK